MRLAVASLRGFVLATFPSARREGCNKVRVTSSTCASSLCGRHSELFHRIRSKCIVFLRIETAFSEASEA